MSRQWPIPEGLCDAGRVAAEAIRDFLVARDLDFHGGGGRFYSPAQWRERGELYGTDSLLIVTHDGGNHAAVFNLDYGQYGLHEQLRVDLEDQGLFVEACTVWYSAVYPCQTTSASAGFMPAATCERTEADARIH
jgi:hypothetical protein